MCCTSVAEFAEVCQKEITKFEADIELDTFDGKTVTLLRFVSKLFYKDDYNCFDNQLYHKTKIICKKRVTCKKKQGNFNFAL
jgi:hypothetical protein